MRFIKLLLIITRMEPNQIRKLRRRQLDARLSTIPVERLKRPRGGWIREVRTVLGMTNMYLAWRLGVSPSAVTQMQIAEINGTIRLKTLARIAKEMDCQLVYAFVPNESLEATVRAQAERIANKIVSRVDHTMSLEAQQNSLDARLGFIKDETEEIIRSPRDLWVSDEL